MVPVRGHTTPPFPPIPIDRDMAVIGPMARSAADLSLLLDVMAGPDPLDTGVAYKLALPPPRHNELKSFRVLVIDSDPILPANREIRDAIEKLAGSLAKSGVSVARQSPLWPDFAESSRLYMRMLISFLATFFPPESIAGAQQRIKSLDPNDRSLAAERLRGMTLSHRAWVMDDGARGRLRAQWRELFKTFDAVICPIMPTPAYPHDHSPEQEMRRINIDGKDFSYPDQLAWPGIATLPGLPATAIPLGLTPQGLPVGVQIVGPWLEDRTPLRLAELIEREFGGFVPPPMFDD
jgi:amidase